jgi:hypothetical protein
VQRGSFAASSRAKRNAQAAVTTYPLAGMHKACQHFKPPDFTIPPYFPGIFFFIFLLWHVTCNMQDHHAKTFLIL